MDEQHPHLPYERVAPLPHSRKLRFKANDYSPVEKVRASVQDLGLQFPKKAQRIACMMCKGGVGKTTTSYFLATHLSRCGARVLVIDADPQGNLTQACHPEFYGFVLGDRTPVLVDVVTNGCSLKQAVLPLTSNFSLLPSTAINSLLETKLIEHKQSFPHQLDAVLQGVDEDYDFIIIDCAPSLNLVNALTIYASNLIILPVQLDGFSSTGLKLTISEIEELQRNFHFQTETKILINNFNPKEKLSFLFLGHLAAEYRSYLMNTTIRRSTEIKTAITLRKEFPSSKASKPKEDFDRLAHEILLRARTFGSLNA